MQASDLAVSAAWGDVSGEIGWSELWLAGGLDTTGARAWIEKPPEFGGQLKKGRYLVAHPDERPHDVAVFGRVVTPRKKASPSVATCTADGIFFEGAPVPGNLVGAPSLRRFRLVYSPVVREQYDWTSAWLRKLTREHEAYATSDMFRIAVVAKTPFRPTLAAALEIHQRVHRLYPISTPAMDEALSMLKAFVAGEALDAAEVARVKAVMWHEAHPPEEAAKKVLAARPSPQQTVWNGFSSLLFGVQEWMKGSDGNEWCYQAIHDGVWLLGDSRAAPEIDYRCGMIRKHLPLPMVLWHAIGQTTLGKAKA